MVILQAGLAISKQTAFSHTNGTANPKKSNIPIPPDNRQRLIP
jgi:hypothetical protein